MGHDHIEYCGMYRYATPDALERALARARERLADDDDLVELSRDWARFFVRSGTTLRIAAKLPAAADRFGAAAVLETLAHTAIEGIVEARRGSARFDVFPSGY
jgi:hypothetical protein